MDQSDRTIIENALKAIGMGGRYYTADGNVSEHIRDPFRSKDDAFCIMMELGLFFGEHVVYWIEGDDILVESFGDANGKTQAARRLIVRVADQIWRNKNVQGS